MPLDKDTMTRLLRERVLKNLDDARRLQADHPAYADDVQPEIDRLERILAQLGSP